MPGVIFVRALPDWIANKPNYPPVFIEAKTVKNSNTPYFSYEYVFYEQHKAWAREGFYFLSIFTDFKADWVQNLHPTKIIWNTSEVRGGSGTPFILIPKISVPNLDDVLTRFLQKKRQ